MGALLRRGRLLILLGAVVLAGCDVPAFMYFLFPNNLQPPDCAELAAPSKDVKIVILVNKGPDARPEFLGADQELAQRLVYDLRRRYKENKDKITLVNPNQVAAFKDKNPDWQTKTIQEIAEAFHADFVINIELDKLDLYEPHSKLLFRGHAEISVKVFDAQKANDGPIYQSEKTDNFPSSGPVDVMDTNNPTQFRDAFLAHLVKEMSRKFASHDVSQTYDFDQ